jgi:hypothetical protein
MCVRRDDTQLILTSSSTGALSGQCPSRRQAARSDVALGKSPPTHGLTAVNPSVVPVEVASWNYKLSAVDFSEVAASFLSWTVHGFTAGTSWTVQGVFA